VRVLHGSVLVVVLRGQCRTVPARKSHGHIRGAKGILWMR
jgi:hypothetical protein